MAALFSRSMLPGLIISETSSRSALLTVVEETGVPPCLPLLSPDPGSHGNNSSVLNEEPTKESRRFVLTSSNAVAGKNVAKQAAPAKKTAANSSAKEVAAKLGAKTVAKDAKGKAAAKSSKNAVDTKDVAKDANDESGLGMGMAAVAAEAKTEEMNVGMMDANDSEVIVEVSESVKSSNRDVDESAQNFVTDEVESDGAQHQQSEDIKVSEDVDKFAKETTAARKDVMIKDAGMDTKVKDASAGIAGKGAKSASWTKDSRKGDNNAMKNPIMTKGADEGKNDTTTDFTAKKDANDSMKDAKDSTKDAKDSTKDAKDSMKDVKKNSTKDAKKNSMKDANDSMKDAKKDSMKDAKKDSTKDAKKNSMKDAKDSMKDVKKNSTKDAKKDSMKDANDSMKDAKKDSMKDAKKESVKDAKDSMKDAKKDSMKDAKKNSMKDAKKESVKDAKDSMKDAKKESVKDAKDSMKDAKDSMKDAKNSMKDAKDSMKDAKDSMKDAKDSMKDAKDFMKDEKDSMKYAKKNEDSAVTPKDAGTGSGEATKQYLKSANNGSKDVSGKSTSLTKDSGKSAKHENHDAHGAKTAGKNAAKNAAKSTKTDVNRVPDAAAINGTINDANEAVTTASNAQTVLATSSETETFDAASSDSVEPIVAAARWRAVQQATGESADFVHFANAEAARRPPVDGMGEKAAPGVLPEESLEEPTREIDPGSSMHLVTTSSSSSKQLSQELEDETPSALSTSRAANATDQASTTETGGISELGEVSSQSPDVQWQQVADIAGLEKIKAEAVAAVRRFFSKNCSTGIPTNGAADEKSDAKPGEPSTLSMQRMQQQSQQAQQQHHRQFESTSCSMHVQISEKAIELFELLETALSQRRRQQRQRSSSRSAQNAANSAGSALAAAVDGGLRDQRYRRCRRRHRHCKEDQYDVSQSTASATLSEAILQEVEFEEVTEEEEGDEEEVQAVTPTKMPMTAATRRSKLTRQRGTNQVTSLMPQSVMNIVRRHFRKG